MEELLLITWVSRPTIVTAHELQAVDPAGLSLLVLGVDHLPPVDLELARTWAVPVIAIGTATTGIAHSLGPKLTSRELKQALRAALLTPSPSAKSAVL
jgi:hypothetical protein